MKAYVLDANVLVRFLTRDVPAQARAAAGLLKGAEKGSVVLHLDPAIVAEVVYVLTSHYKISRKDVAQALVAVIRSPGIQAEAEGEIVDALLRFQSMTVDFADAWLAARATALKIPVASFDRDLDKFKDISRVQPKG